MNLNPLDQLDPFVIGSVVLIFIATYVVLRKVFVLPYLEVMERREALFDAGHDRTDEAGRVEREADFAAEKALTEAAAWAEQAVVDARERADSYRRETTGAAIKSAAERLESGRASIAAARSAEIAQLRAQAVECAGLACEQLLGEPDRASVEAAIDRLMARRIH